uniref:Uncharacterized protein n=1 Tax=Takifugu rubripes TaxID=31033 RepID=A0A3B5KBZ8_TAKRU
MAGTDRPAWLIFNHTHRFSPLTPTSTCTKHTPVPARPALISAAMDTWQDKDRTEQISACRSSVLKSIHRIHAQGCQVLTPHPPPPL